MAGEEEKLQNDLQRELEMKELRWATQQRERKVMLKWAHRRKGPMKEEAHYLVNYPDEEEKELSLNSDY